MSRAGAVTLSLLLPLLLLGGGAPPASASAPPLPLPDRFVSAGPLSVAAVCRDGVVLAAYHPGPADEPLLLPPEEAAPDSDGHVNNNGNDNGNGGGGGGSGNLAVPDLPRKARGPHRIAEVDGRGTALLAVGWRADGTMLADRCRAVAAEEAADYAWGGDDEGNGGGGGDNGYAAALAADASLWLARRASSAGVRTMRCAGLLASGGGGGGGQGGCLYLLDAAGVHRVRALAVGRGSDAVNRRLLAVDFMPLGRDAAARRLLEVVNGGEGRFDGKEKDDEDKDGDDLDNNNDNGNFDRGQPPLLPKGSRVELAFVDARRMTRIRQSELLL